jgi:hypothetical protein
MQINVKIETENLKTRTLREVKNLAYSTSQALNATAKDVQAAERVHMDRTYHLRRAGFMYRLIKIFKFSNARQGIPWTEIGVENKSRVILSTFEEGGQRKPVKGKNVAVPITGSFARPTDTSTIPDEYTFRKMKFKRHLTSGGKTQWKGESHTFLIPGIGVFQRIGTTKTERRAKTFTGRSSRILESSKALKLLYKLLSPGSIKQLPANLHLGRIARQEMQQKFIGYFTRFNSRFKK